MLTVPQHGNSYFTILGIDPGTMFMGVSLMNVDVLSYEIVSTTAFTLRAGIMLSKESWNEINNGARYARIRLLEQELLNLFRQYNPLMIVSESPFYNPRMPGAFAALVETLAAIRAAIRLYDIWKHLYTIDPSSVKNAVNVGGGVGKDAVNKSILNMPQLNYFGNTPIHLLDNNAIDAIAVAYSLYKLTKDS